MSHTLPHTSYPPRSRLRRHDIALVVAGMALTTALALALVRRPTLGLALLVLVALVALVLLARGRIARQRIGALLAAGLAALPLLALLGPSLALPAIPQLFAFRLVLLLVSLVGITYLIVRPQPLPFAAMDIALPAVLWFAWTWLGLLWASDKMVGLSYLAVVTTMVALMAAAAATGATRRRLAAFCVTMVVAYVGIVGFTVLEARLGLRLPASRFSSSTSQTYAVTSVFHNQNDFATYLAICWPFLLCAFFFARRLRWLLLAVALIAFGAAAFVRTGSRSSLIAIGISSLVGLVLLAHLTQCISSRSSKIVAGVFSVALVVGCGYLLFNDSENEMLRQFRLESLLAQAQTGTGSGAIRSDLTSMGLEIVGGTFLIGAGPDQAEVIIASGVGGFGISNLHNWWLETFANGGLVGFALHLIFFLGLLLALWPIIHRDADRLLRYLASGTFLALFGFVIGALGPSSSVGFAPMWILYGLGLAVVSRARLAAREPALSATRAGAGDAMDGGADARHSADETVAT